MKKSRKIFLSFGGIIASSLVLVSAITVANQENWNEFQRTAAEDLKTFIESQKKLRSSGSTRENLYVPDGYKKPYGEYKNKILDFAIVEKQLQSVYDFFIQLPSFNQINDEDSKNEWLKEITTWFLKRPDLYFATFRRHETGSIEWRFMPNEPVTDEDHAAENAIEAFDSKIKDLITFKTLNEYTGRFNTYQEFESYVLNELQEELKKEVYNAPRAYYDNFVTILKNATVDPNVPNDLNRNIPQDLSNTLLNWLKYSQDLNRDEKARGGNYDKALELLGDDGLIGINKKIAQIRAKLATYQEKKSSFDYKFEPEEPEKADFDSEKAKLTTQLEELQKKLNGLNTAIDGKIEKVGWNTKKQEILNLTTTNQELATGLSTYIVAEEKLEGLLKYREKVTELKKILEDSNLSDEQKKSYTDKIDKLGDDADNYNELVSLGDDIKNSIEADSNAEPIINKFSLWTNEEQKNPYREKIKTIYKDSKLTEEEKQAKLREIEEEIFNQMKNNANGLIDQTSLTNTEKISYKNTVNNESMDRNNNPYDFPLIKTITKAKIDDLDDLNPAQKEYFKSKIDQSDIDTVAEVNEILAEAEKINKKMNDYKNAFKDENNIDSTNVTEIKKSTNYTEADSDKKTTFDNALTTRNSDLSSPTLNLTSEQIDQKITALKQAKEDLNGVENLVEAKRKAKEKLNTTYTYLNDAQKTEANNKIDALTTVNDVNNQDAKNKQLDDAMKVYSQSPADIETIRTGTDYTQADNQSTLEDLITTKTNDTNKTTGPNLTLEQVNGKITALNNAVTALNGEERLKKAKDDAIAKINSDYSSLTPKQKEKAIALINEQTTIDGVTNQDATNSALNSSMEILRNYITNQSNITTGNNYTYTTNALREAYDGNPTKNSNQKGGVIKEAEDLLAALDTDNNDNLMNKTNVDALNTKIQNAINNLNGQQRYDDEVARLNNLATATAKVKDNVKNTDTASQISNDEIEFDRNTIPQDVTPTNLSISNPNEVTGKLDLSYKYQSTKENLETVTSTKTYILNNDNALSTLTEQERLDKLVEDSTVTKTVDFNGTDKSNFAASDLTANNFSTIISPNTDAKVIIDTIQPDPDDPRGVIVTYKLESTKTNLGDTKVTSSKSLTTKITGFMTNKEKEQKTINSYNKSNFLSTPEPLILASSFVNNLDGVNIIFDPNDNIDHKNETIVVKSIKSWDDKIGKLVVNFVVESNKNGEKLTSDLKEITINGYMTEKDRLNYLLTDQAKSFEFNGPKAQNKTTVDEVKLSELSGYIRGTNENGEFINANGINNVNLIIDAITGRDSQNGSITFTYHLVSTRTDIPNNDVVSDTQTYSLGLFQTNNEREKEVLNAKGPNDLDITVNKTKLASKYTNDEITLSSHDENISVIEKQIIGYNDITGEIKLSYKLRNEQSGVESDTKEIIIDGFKTESQRLNEILNSLLKNDINFDGNKKDQLPSMAPANNKANYSYDETKQTANKANIGINSITANNQTGENSLNLKLISTKTQNELVSNWEVTNFSAPESSNKDLIVDGFRTQAEQDKIDQDAEKQRLTSLVAHAEITYPNSKQILASSALKSGLNTVITSTDNNAEIIIKNITDKNDLTGQITVEYVIHSTKGGIYENVNTDVQTVTLNNFKTEQERLDALFADKVATASLNGIVSSEYKKYLPKDALEYLLLDIANLENAKVVIVSKEANDQTHAIDYAYRLVSTRGEVNGHNLNNVESSTTKNGSLNGFKTLSEAEKERLDAISVDNEDDKYTHTIDYRDRATKLASKATINDENWIWNITPDTDHTFSDQEIIAYDDITGKIKVKYKLQSTKTGFTDVKSDYKYATLTGFKTELQRLNELVKQQNQPAQITAKDDAKASGSNPKQPSQLTSSDFDATLTEAGKNENVAVETILDTQNANDETGEIALGYKLISTRPLNGTNGLVSGEWENPITVKPTIKSNTSEPLTTFNGYLTNDDVEIKRIENLIANLTLDYPDKEQYLPLYNEDDVIDSKVQVGLNNGKTLEAENIEIKTNSMQITTRDDRKGEVVVSYTIVSKTRPDVKVEINATRSKNANTITGFKTEQQRLNALNYDWTNAIANKEQINPADVNLSDITPIVDTNDQAQEIRIIGYNERTGEVNIKYNIYSKRTDLTDIYVTDKTATITGLQTESQRLDALIKNNDVDKSIVYVPNDQAVTKASSLVNNKEEVIKNLNNQYFNSAIANPVENKAKIIIQDIEADDETGNLTVKYVLQSTKDNLSDITSSQSQTLTISGFLTNLQEAKNNLKAKIDKLVTDGSLSNDQAQSFKDEIDNEETNTILKVDAIELKVDKQVVINQAKIELIHLNPNQLNNVIENITNADTLDKAKSAKTDGEVLNNKMLELKNAIESAKNVPDSQAYKNAEVNVKEAFDNALEVANKIKNGNNNIEEGDQFNYNATLDEVNDAIEKLKLAKTEINRDDALKYVAKAPYLSENEKTDLSTKLNKKVITDEEIANLKKQAIQINDVKKPYIDEIKAIPNNFLNEEEKQTYINQIINESPTFDESNNLTNPSDFETIVINAKKAALINQLGQNVNQPNLPKILNPKQVSEAKSAIQNAPDLAQAQKTYDDALKLADKMYQLKDKIEKLDKLIEPAANVKYHKATNQEQFNEKLQSAKDLLISNTDNGVDNKLLDNLLSNKEPSLQYAYDILDGKLVELKETINNNEYLNQDEKDNLIDRLNTIPTNPDLDKNMLEVNQNFETTNKAKKDNCDSILNFEYLNQSQKDYWSEQIKTNDNAQGNTLVNEAQAIDNKMHELLDLVNEETNIKNGSAYQNAKSEDKTKYENALNEAKRALQNETVEEFNKINLTKAEVQILIDNLKLNTEKIIDENNSEVAKQIIELVKEYEKSGNIETKKTIDELKNQLYLEKNKKNTEYITDLIQSKHLLKWLLDQYTTIQDLQSSNSTLAKEDLINELKHYNELVQLYNDNPAISSIFINNYRQVFANIDLFKQYAEIKVKFTDNLLNSNKDELTQNIEQLSNFKDNRYIQNQATILSLLKDKLTNNEYLKLLKLKNQIDPIDFAIVNHLMQNKLGVNEKLSNWWYALLGLGIVGTIALSIIIAKRNKK